MLLYYVKFQFTYMYIRIPETEKHFAASAAKIH